MKRQWTAMLLAALLAAAPGAHAGEVDDAVLERAAVVAVQDGGRVKPLSTVASFALLRIHHKRTFRDEATGAKRTALAWLVDAMLHPKAARAERVFLVENDRVLDALGVAHDGKKRRDRYAYDDLRPARRKLLELGHEYSAIDAKKRSPVQGQIVHLAQNFLEFERLTHFLDFARVGIRPAGGLAAFFDGREAVRTSEALAALPELRRAAASGEAGLRDELAQLERGLARCFSGSRGLALLPPAGEGSEWLSPHDAADAVLAGGTLAPAHADMLRHLEGLVAADGDAARLQKHLDGVLAGSRGREDSAKVASEVSYYRADLFHKGLLLYVLAFVLVAVSWLRPHRWLTRAAAAAATGGLAVHAAGIVWRCVLRERPPVSTLYETVLFIAAVCVLSALVMELIHRRRIALAAAPVLGAVGLFIAARFEEINRADTMPQLVAVLDTNFWLATHVTCITIGYAAGLLASAIAHVWVFGKLFRLKRNEPAFYKGIARMVYGVTCFALLFSVVGTILGGVWANESWGRFWGWDPKENGALLIVLGQLALIHARMGGYIKEKGICLAAIAGGMIVAFSWWGVNLLGVGLHSYGFTEGVWTALLTFYALEGAVLAAGAVPAGTVPRTTSA